MKIALITGSCGLVGSESATFFSKKGFKIIGIDNNYRKVFFGKDGDISWLRSKLKKELKNYKHFNTDIRNYNNLKKIFNQGYTPVLIGMVFSLVTFFSVCILIFILGLNI